MACSIGMRVRMHYLKIYMKETPNIGRQVWGYRMGAYLCLGLFVVSLLSWIGLMLALRFDWKRNDVAGMEILVYRTTSQLGDPERRIEVTDTQTISGILDALALLKPYQLQHEHPVGRSYALRLRRQSTGDWSRYRVKVYPDSQATDGASMRDTYRVSPHCRWGRINLGNYRAVELGTLVEQVVKNEGANRPE